MKIQEVKSPGGITAWLVEEHSVPLIALRFAFDGGNAQDPEGKEGLANFLASMLDEGAGDLNAKQFQERMEEIAMRMGFDDCARCLLRQLRDADREPRQGRRAAGAGAQQAALRRRCGGPHPRAAAGRARSMPRAIPTGSPPRRGRRRRSPVTRTAGRPTARSSRCKKITREDLAALRTRMFAKDTLSVVVVGDIDAKTLAGMLDQMFGGLPAKAKLTPVAQTDPQGHREAEGGRDGGAAVGRPLRPAGHAAQGQGFPARVRAQPDRRRRRDVVAAVGGGAREARAGLFGLHIRAAVQAHLGVRRRRRHQERGDRPVARR